MRRTRRASVTSQYSLKVNMHLMEVQTTKSEAFDHHSHSKQFVSFSHSLWHSSVVVFLSCTTLSNEQNQFVKCM
jgi:Mg2+ and Co2+ transporter CorA